MTLRALPNPIYYPVPQGGAAGAPPAFATLTMDANADRVSFVFQAPKTGTLDRFEFCLGTVTTAVDMKIGWYDVDATAQPARPSGSAPTHYRVVAAASVAAGWVVPASFTNDGTGTGTKKSVTKGDFVAGVIEPDGAGVPSLLVNVFDISAAAAQTTIVPWCINNLTGSYAISTEGPVGSVFYDGETSAVHVGLNLYPYVSFGTQAVSTSNPDMAGLRFQVPFRCTVTGFWVRADLDGDFTARILGGTFDSSSNLVSVAIDKDQRASSASAGSEYKFTSTVTLEPNTTYRLLLQGTTATALTMAYATVNSVNNLVGAGCAGPECYWTQTDVAYASLTGAGDFSDTTTRMPYLGLIISEIDDGLLGRSPTYALGI